jgi:hypothetical protein
MKKAVEERDESEHRAPRALQLRGRGGRRLEPLKKARQSTDKTARETPKRSIPGPPIPGEYPLPGSADESDEVARATAPLDVDVHVDVEPTGVILVGSEPGRGGEDGAIVAKSAARGSVFEMRSREVNRRGPVRATVDWPMGRGRAVEPEEACEGGGEAEAADPWPELPDWPFADPNDDAVAADVRAAEREELGRLDVEQAGGAWNA